MQRGLQTERIILTAPVTTSAPLNSNTNSEIRFAIPSERELKRARRMSYSSSNDGIRKIAFIGDGVEVSQPTNLPFKPPGLQWQGPVCITSRQLEQHRQEKIGKLHKNFKDANLL